MLGGVRNKIKKVVLCDRRQAHSNKDVQELRQYYNNMCSRHCSYIDVAVWYSIWRIYYGRMGAPKH